MNDDIIDDDEEVVYKDITKPAGMRSVWFTFSPFSSRIGIKAQQKTPPSSTPQVGQWKPTQLPNGNYA